jgi:hypothetical protein
MVAPEFNMARAWQRSRLIPYIKMAPAAAGPIHPTAYFSET